MFSIKVMLEREYTMKKTYLVEFEVDEHRDSLTHILREVISDNLGVESTVTEQGVVGNLITKYIDYNTSETLDLVQGETYEVINQFVSWTEDGTMVNTFAVTW